MAKVVQSPLASVVALVTALVQLVGAVLWNQGTVVLSGCLVALRFYFRVQGGAPGSIEDCLTLSPFVFGLSVMRSLDTRNCTRGGIYHLCL